MKIVLISILIIAFSATTTLAQFDNNKLFYTRKAEKYKKVKTTGAILTIAGSILTVAGVSAIANSTTNYYGNNSSSTRKQEVGTVALLLGMGGLGAGIPLWIVGAHSEKKYLRKLENASIRFNHNNDRSSISLTYRF